MKRSTASLQNAFNQVLFGIVVPLALIGSSFSDWTLASCSQQQLEVSETTTEDDDDPLTKLLQQIDKKGGRRSAKELRKIRRRTPGYYEKQNTRNLQTLAPATEAAGKSTFEVIAGKYWVSMGMVVTADGYAVTKASELEEFRDVKCRFSSRTVDAKVQKIDLSNDVALLKLAPGSYQPVKLASPDPAAGTILLTPGIRKPVLAMGVCSVTSRSLRSEGFLGVDPEEESGGIRIRGVERDAAAATAGLKTGDIIRKIDGDTVSKLDQFVNIIRRAGAGGTLDIEIQRGENKQNFSVTLGFRRNGNRLAKRYQAMDLLGTIKSARSGRFPWAFQHDTALLPEHCGGPVVDVEGRVVGMNISRGGRIRSYGIGNPWLVKLLKNWSVNPAQ